MGQNNGLIQLTGVGSRFIGYYVAVILAVLGLFPFVGGVLNTLPPSTLGGATILMFGAVAMAGINILLECLKLKHKMNHFALRNRIYVKALQKAMCELYLLKSASHQLLTSPSSSLLVN